MVVKALLIRVEPKRGNANNRQGNRSFHNECSPSDDIDILWHQILLDTEYYYNYCKKNFNLIIHHKPQNSLDDNKEKNLNNFNNLDVAEHTDKKFNFRFVIDIMKSNGFELFEAYWEHIINRYNIDSTIRVAVFFLIYFTYNFAYFIFIIIIYFFI